MPLTIDTENDDYHSVSVSHIVVMSYSKLNVTFSKSSSTFPTSRGTSPGPVSGMVGMTSGCASWVAGSMGEEGGGVQKAEEDEVTDSDSGAGKSEEELVGVISGVVRGEGEREE